MADRDVLEARVESIRRCIDRIRTKTPTSAKELENDYDAQDIISINLQRAVQLSVDVGMHLISLRGWSTPDTMAGTFTVLVDNNVLERDIAERMRRGVGFRNISVHEYQDVDWQLVYRLVTERLDDFRAFIDRVLSAWEAQ